MQKESICKMLGKGDIKEKILQINNLYRISCDIFDTFIFRMVAKPEEIFEIVGEQAVKLKAVATYLEPEDFRNIRIRAEKEARCRKNEIEGTREVTLEEIYSFIPNVICLDKEKLKQIELQTEQEYCYLNQDVLNILLEYYQKGIEIYFISDMYLNEKQIRKLLRALGTPECLLQNIFVSCDYGVAKSNGKLFSVIEANNFKKGGWLHIGDNYQADILGARTAGLESFYYNLAMDNSLQGMVYEEILLNHNLPELSWLRRYSAQQYSEDIGHRNWFTLGAAFFAPLLVGTVEWVLDTAQENGINTIFPLMREGKLYAQLLREGAKARNVSINIKELYVSRKSVFIPSIDKITKMELETLLSAPKNTLHDTFVTLGIADYEKEFKSVFGEESGKNFYSVVDNLYTFLQREDVAEAFQVFIDEKTENAWGYLLQMGVNERFISLDIGCHGTIQTSLEKILRKKKIENHNIHMLTFGVKTALKNVFENVDLRGFVGNYGGNDDLCEFFMGHPRIMEEILMCYEGSTKDYVRTKGIYEPVLGESPHDIIEQRKLTEIVQKGICEFQRQYLRLSAEKNFLKEKLLKKANEAAEIYKRLHQFPTKEESTLLGNLFHDDNFGRDESYRMCEPEKIEYIRQYGKEAFLKEYDIAEEPWLEGLFTIADNRYEFSRICDNAVSRLGKGMAVMAKEIIREISKEKIVIVGAGDAGKMLAMFLRVAGVEIEAFVDNNQQLQNSLVNGIEVRSMESRFEAKCFALGTLTYADRLVEQALNTLPISSTVYYTKDQLVKKIIIE